MVRARSHLSLDKEGKFRRRKAPLLRLHEPNGQLFGSDFALLTYSSEMYMYNQIPSSNQKCLTTNIFLQNLNFSKTGSPQVSTNLHNCIRFIMKHTLEKF